MKIPHLDHHRTHQWAAAQGSCLPSPSTSRHLTKFTDLPLAAGHLRLRLSHPRPFHHLHHSKHQNRLPDGDSENPLPATVFVVDILLAATSDPISARQTQLFSAQAWMMILLLESIAVFKCW